MKGSGVRIPASALLNSPQIHQKSADLQDDPRSLLESFGSEVVRFDPFSGSILEPEMAILEPEICILEPEWHQIGT